MGLRGIALSRLKKAKRFAEVAVEKSGRGIQGYYDIAAFSAQRATEMRSRREIAVVPEEVSGCSGCSGLE
ncbi:MAG: hypothetical protein QI223_06360 [Candidatus Korarchaeota archaeon]|nr:hypothetical protein [Candidatus Korarchaeota archaeon]